MIYANDAMTVSDLIELLRAQPPDLLVAYRCYSEITLLRADEINVVEACEPRPDGWVHGKRPDKPSRPYLVLPGS